MPSPSFEDRCGELLDHLDQTGQRKRFHWLTGALGPTAHIEGLGEVVILCSNNYLGLADHPEVRGAAINGIETYGAGTASVRFICGSLVCHRELEQTIAEFVGAEASLSYVSCYSANEAVFPTLCAPGDVILSDELNHASIIDSCRLVGKSVERTVYPHSDMDALEDLLTQHRDKPCRWVVSDGVFSMEGDVVKLPELVELCEKHNAMLVLDDSHGVGVMGATGRGTPEHFDCLGRVEMLTGTLGKALGGAAGGYAAASRRAIDVLQQRSRPSLFSNALPATVACSARKAVEIVQREPQRVDRLHGNVKRIRDGLAKLGYECPPSPTAIIPIMIGDEADALAKGQRLLELGVMVVGFAFPVVPKGEARLRVQASAALTQDHIEKALDAFAKL